MKKSTLDNILFLARKTAAYQQAKRANESTGEHPSNVKFIDFQAQSPLDKAISLAAKQLAKIDATAIND